MENQTQTQTQTPAHTQTVLVSEFKAVMTGREITCYKSNKRAAHKRMFRAPINVAEMIQHCSRNSHIWFLTNQGDARTAKVNGRVRTWKRDAGRVEVPIKYGMYEYGTLTAADIERVLIEIVG